MQASSSSNTIFLGFFSLLLMIVLALMGCGGGSAGTGTGVGTGDGPVVVLQGAVLDQSGAPVEDVSVRVVETGSQDTTAANGSFQILTESDTETITLEISSETGVAYVTVNVPSEGGNVSVTLRVNPKLTEISSDALEVGAGIVGRCDQYFENRLIIRQANPVPGGTSCVAKVSVSEGERKLANVPFVVQYRDCDQLMPWTTVAAGATMDRPNRGIGQVEFPFVDDEVHCLYRIAAPVGVPGLPELERIVHTSTFQRRQ
jgi:hypothetical protein